MGGNGKYLDTSNIIQDCENEPGTTGPLRRNASVPRLRRRVQDEPGESQEGFRGRTEALGGKRYRGSQKDPKLHLILAASSILEAGGGGA